MQECTIVRQFFQGDKLTTDNEFILQYLALRLRQRRPNAGIKQFCAIVSTAEITPIPYQLQAAEFAVKAMAEQGGAILADEVGLGKTIEAGIVIAQYWFAGKRSILVITPATLIEQWHHELTQKFHLPVTILDHRSFRVGQKQQQHNPFRSNSIVICSYHFARNRHRFIAEIPWHLAVIDEAHNLRNREGVISATIRRMLRNVPKLLLTATPLQNSLDELYALANFVNEDIGGEFSQIGTHATPEALALLKTRMEPILRRTLRKDSMQFFTRRITSTTKFTPSADEQRLYDGLDRYLRRKTLYAIPDQQRHMTGMILRRLMGSSSFALCGTLGKLRQRLNDLLLIHQPIPEPVPDMTQAELERLEFLRQLKSCQRHALSPSALDTVGEELACLNELQALSAGIDRNVKGNALLTVLKSALSQAEERKAPRKALIFTEFIQTQNYLRDLLESDPAFTGKTVMFRGGNDYPQAREVYRRWKEENPDDTHPEIEMKNALLRHFETEAEIMIATEAAAEGLNLQFCAVVINFDLPWNPQRIEQRIGRCHRYGQKSDVAVINFLNEKNYAEERLHHLLTVKLKLFDSLFGASDQVLGSLFDGEDFAQWVYQFFQECRTREEIDREVARKEAQIDRQLRKQDQSGWKNLEAYFEHQFHVDSEELRQEVARSRNDFQTLMEHFCAANLPNENPEDIIDVMERPKFFVYKRHWTDEITRCYADPHLSSSFAYWCFKAPATPSHPLARLAGKQGWLLLTHVTVETIHPADSLIAVALTRDGEEICPFDMDRLLELPLSQAGVLPDGPGKRIYIDRIEQLTEQAVARQIELDSACYERYLSDLTVRQEHLAQLEQAAQQAHITALTRQLSAKLPPNERESLQRRIDRAWLEYEHNNSRHTHRMKALISEARRKYAPRSAVRPLYYAHWQIDPS